MPHLSRPSLSWSDSALEDLQRLTPFAEQRDAALVARMLDAIDAGVALLLEHPGIGVAVAGAPHLRDWTIRFGRSGYVVRYRPSDAAVVIVSLRHGLEAQRPR